MTHIGGTSCSMYNYIIVNRKFFEKICYSKNLYLLRKVTCTYCMWINSDKPGIKRRWKGRFEELLNGKSRVTCRNQGQCPM